MSNEEQTYTRESLAAALGIPAYRLTDELMRSLVQDGWLTPVEDGGGND